ncbi:MAG: hypothetical protein JJT94_17345 [Bernardetiaceae bacterium]|nr:hypothetical protein [Bernardetiaceae bacterium]
MNDLANIINPLDTIDVPEITILGSNSARERGLFANVPGSARYIGPKELRRLQAISGNEALPVATKPFAV